MNNEDLNKKSWTPPNLDIINFKDTQGGNFPADHEDLDVDEYSQFSPP